MAARAAVQAALARMDAARNMTAEYAPIDWHRWSSCKRGQCHRCGARSGLLISHVRPIRIPARQRAYGGERPAQRYSQVDEVCVDEAACRERTRRAYEKRQRRSGNLRWAQSRFESPNIDLPKGSCRWCGEPIVFVEDVPYRMKRRERHRGDEYEVGDRNCRREHDRTFAATPRHLIMHRGDPCCVDCGEAELYVVPDDGSPGWWQAGNWEADHVVAIEDGGAHEPTNIARRCVRCHREKTNRENAARRAKRRVDKAQAARVG